MNSTSRPAWTILSPLVSPPFAPASRKQEPPVYGAGRPTQHKLLRCEAAEIQQREKIIILALPCPRPRPNALPGPRGPGRTWGRRGVDLPGPPYPHSSAPSSYLCLALVSVPGSVSLGAPAVVLVFLSFAGSPCPLSAPEWAALPCPDPEVVLLPAPAFCPAPYLSPVPPPLASAHRPPMQHTPLAHLPPSLLL